MTLVCKNQTSVKLVEKLYFLLDVSMDLISSQILTTVA